MRGPFYYTDSELAEITRLKALNADLLAACEALYAESTPKVPDPEGMLHAREQARAAIAKAGGA